FGRRRFPYAFTGWFWYLGTLVPVIGIVQVGSQAFADRYTYIPSIGIAISIVWLIAEVSQRSGRRKEAPSNHDSLEFMNMEPLNVVCYITVLIATLILCILSWQTNQQLGYWRDTETVFGRVLELAPDSVQALYGLGSHLIDGGRIEEGKKLVERAVA